MEKKNLSQNVIVDQYKNELVELCKSFDWESQAAIPVNSLVGVLNHYISDTELYQHHIVEVTSNFTRVIAFLTSMCELSRVISNIEQKNGKSDITNN